jgi:hypothetical protein
MLLLALSCLQGRPMGAALDALLALEPDGVQLTPGNQPTAGFDQQVATLRTRTHHGFSFTHWKASVWRDDGSCAAASDSVHPPLSKHPAYSRFLDAPKLPVLETMYPGNGLGTGAELDEAMRRGLELAVDVSHVFIQLAAGVIAESTWRRLQDYAHVAEVHVSRNDGRSDAHLPLTETTFGLEWALERLRAGTPVILESYFHRVGDDARRAQVALFDEART